MFNWLLIDKCLIMLFKANWCLYLCHQTSSTPTIPITLTFWTLLISDQLKWGFVGRCSPPGPLTALKRLWFQNPVITASVLKIWRVNHTARLVTCVKCMYDFSPAICVFFMQQLIMIMSRGPRLVFAYLIREEKSQVMIQCVSECLCGYFCGCVTMDFRGM